MGRVAGRDRLKLTAMSLREALVERSRDDADELGEISIVEVTPSRRDFLLYVATQRAELAAIGAVSPVRAKLAARLTTLDEQELAALAVRIGDDADALPPAQLADLQSGLGTPLLRLDYLVSRAQVYQSRLSGADAVLLPALLGAEQLGELAAVAQSVHMAVVVEATTAEEVQLALTMPRAVVGLSAIGRGESPQETAALGALVDPARVTILLTELDDLELARRLRGRVDAVVLHEHTALAAGGGNF